MEVLVGQALNMEVSSTSAYVRERGTVSPAQDNHCVNTRNGFRSDFVILGSNGEKGCVEDSSGSSSSIGAPDDASDEDDAVTSKLNGKLGSLSSLEDALPIKRGLSSHFTGKSKSFADLTEVSEVKDLVKQENPFNKRRRVLISSKFARKSSFYSGANPKSMPLLPLNEEGDEEDKEQQEEDNDDEEVHVLADHDERKRISKFHKRGLNNFKSRSCFSLADLQEHEEQ